MGSAREAAPTGEQQETSSSRGDD